ncbi:hypothetical protein CR513_17355, partial [Mucuna pruriens]
MESPPTLLRKASENLGKDKAWYLESNLRFRSHLHIRKVLAPYDVHPKMLSVVRKKPPFLSPILSSLLSPLPLKNTLHPKKNRPCFATTTPFYRPVSPSPNLPRRSIVIIVVALHKPLLNVEVLSRCSFHKCNETFIECRGDFNISLWSRMPLVVVIACEGSKSRNARKLSTAICSPEAMIRKDSRLDIGIGPKLVLIRIGVKPSSKETSSYSSSLEQGSASHSSRSTPLDVIAESTTTVEVMPPSQGATLLTLLAEFYDWVNKEVGAYKSFLFSRMIVEVFVKNVTWVGDKMAEDFAIEPCSTVDHYATRIDVKVGWVSLSPLPKMNLFNAYSTSYKGFKGRFVKVRLPRGMSCKDLVALAFESKPIKHFTDLLMKHNFDFNELCRKALAAKKASKDSTPPQD